MLTNDFGAGCRFEAMNSSFVTLICFDLPAERIGRAKAAPDTLRYSNLLHLPDSQRSNLQTVADISCGSNYRRSATSMMANTRTREGGAYPAGLGGPIPYGDMTNPTTAAREEAFV